MTRPPWGPKMPPPTDPLVWVIVAVATTVIGWVLERVFSPKDRKEKPP